VSDDRDHEAEAGGQGHVQPLPKDLLPAHIGDRGKQWDSDDRDRDQ
jgi:hypothetical protein